MSLLDKLPNPKATADCKHRLPGERDKIYLQYPWREQRRKCEQINYKIVKNKKLPIGITYEISSLYSHGQGAVGGQDTAEGGFSLCLCKTPSEAWGVI